jgi:hypothetical protein
VTKVSQVHRWLGRAIGLDLHREFCEIAICESGQTYGGGRVAMTAEGIEAFAASLEPTDRVVMEVSSSAWEVARRLEGRCERVVVVSPDDTGIAHARAKTDKSAWTAAHPRAMKCSLHGLAGGPTSSLG